jgi:hypothetical protein
MTSKPHSRSRVILLESDQVDHDQNPRQCASPVFRNSRTQVSITWSPRDIIFSSSIYWSSREVVFCEASTSTNIVSEKPSSGSLTLRSFTGVGTEHGGGVQGLRSILMTQAGGTILKSVSYDRDSRGKRVYRIKANLFFLNPAKRG